MKTLRLPTRFIIFIGALLPLSELFSKDEPLEKASARDLAEVQREQQDFLRSATSVCITRDGKFLYAAAFNSSTVAAFKRDAASGKIENDASMETPELAAAVSIVLSADDQFAAVSAFRANAVSLFKRDAVTGELIFLDAAIQGKDGAAGLTFAIDAIFSPDNRFLYSAAATGVGIFRIEKDKLVFVKEETVADGLENVRGLAISPDGAILYATGADSNTVVVFRRDKDSGKLENLQVLSDGKDGTDELEGAFRIACSQDGKHVYISSGRFSGDQAISVFATQPDGKLKLIEEHVNGVGSFTGFKGGNTIVVSPDGSLVYAVGTMSDTLVRFRRDAATGKLTFLGSQMVGELATPGACGLTFSPDGKFVYVADEMSSSIVVFKQP